MELVVSACTLLGLWKVGINWIILFLSQNNVGIDLMLARYLQASEQVKAASQPPVHHYSHGPVHYRHSGEHYHLPRTPAYTLEAAPSAAAGQYIYPHY